MEESYDPWRISDPGDPVSSLLGPLTEAVDGLVGVDPDDLPVDAAGDLLRGLRRQRSRLEAVEAGLTASFDRRGAYRAAGHTSMQSWLQGRLGMAPGDAHRQVTTADALASTLEATRQALTEGEISFAHAAAVAEGARRQPEPERAEQQLLRTAKQADPRQVSQQARRMAMQGEPDQGDREARRQYDSRGLLTRRTQGGMVFLEGQLHQLAGERLLQALARDARPTDDDTRTPAQRNADALCHWVDAALDGPARSGGDRGGDRSRRAQMVVLVPLETIERRAGARPGTLTWTGPCPPAALAELVCQAELSWLITDPAGLPLSFGRTERWATDDQWLALVARDGGCRWPACSAPAAWCVAHHEPDWPAGGRTDIDTQLLLCAAHHGMRHHGGWRLALDPDAAVTVTSPDGRTVLTESAARARARHLHAAGRDHPPAPRHPPTVAHEHRAPYHRDARRPLRDTTLWSHPTTTPPDSPPARRVHDRQPRHHAGAVLPAPAPPQRPRSGRAPPP